MYSSPTLTFVPIRVSAMPSCVTSVQISSSVSARRTGKQSAKVSRKIKAHAEKRGESINGFVGRAISETMQRDALELPGAGQTDPDTESKRAALLEKLQGIPAGNDSKE